MLSVSDCLCQLTLVNRNKVVKPWMKRVYAWLTCYELIGSPTRYLSTEDTRYDRIIIQPRLENHPRSHIQDPLGKRAV